MARILVIDDDASLREVVRFILSEAGHEVATAESGEVGLERLPEGFDLVVTDVKMPGMDGMEVLRRIQKDADPQTPPVIVLTAHGTVDQAVTAMKLGAFTYLLKPFQREDLKHTVEQALHTGALERDNARLRTLLKRSGGSGMIYRSQAMQKVMDTLKRAAPSTASVLLTGQSGTGKELAARALHDLSDRWDGPYVAVNCGALPVELIESELFGHAKGSFTGAQKASLGRIRAEKRA